jgi:hypothetical protein
MRSEGVTLSLQLNRQVRRRNNDRNSTWSSSWKKQHHPKIKHEMKEEVRLVCLYPSFLYLILIQRLSPWIQQSHGRVVCLLDFFKLKERVVLLSDADEIENPTMTKNDRKSSRESLAFTWGISYAACLSLTSDFLGCPLNSVIITVHLSSTRRSLSIMSPSGSSSSPPSSFLSHSSNSRQWTQKELFRGKIRLSVSNVESPSRLVKFGLFLHKMRSRLVLTCMFSGKTSRSQRIADPAREDFPSKGNLNLLSQRGLLVFHVIFQYWVSIWDCGRF